MLSSFIYFFKKGSSSASFFLYILYFSSNFVSAQEHRPVAVDYQWRALLHIPKNSTLISDPQFVSQGRAPALTELRKGIDALSSEDLFLQQDYLCRFPARSLWIQKNYPELNLTLDPRKNCLEFNEFLHSVPAQSIELVYAYENIAHPASMMGHVFLKLKGVSDQGIPVEHAISFYTDTMTLNFPKLLFDSLVVGKKGYFTVSPYQYQLQQYNVQEQRNVIEYELILDDFSRKLIQYHIWELKDVDLLYYFNSFNCATLTNDLVGIASPFVLAKSTDWVSPLDVVKASSNAKLLGNSNLRASNSWKIRMLEDTLAQQGIDAETYINGEVPLNSLSENQRFLLSSLEESHIDFIANSNAQQRPMNSEERDILHSKWGVQNTNQYIELSGYKDPLTRSNDSQFNISLNHQDDILLEYIPTSHQLNDDHRSSFSESELQLLSFKGRVSLRDSSTQFDEIGLYKMASFIPYDSFTGGLSKRFSIGGKQEYDEDLDEQFIAYMSGSTGLSYRLHKDLLVYSLLNVQLDESDGANVSYGPEVGFFLYEIFSQKTTLSYSENYNQSGSVDKVQKLKVAQTWFANKDYSFVVHYENTRIKDNYREQIGLELRYYY